MLTWDQILAHITGLIAGIETDGEPFRPTDRDGIQGLTESHGFRRFWIESGRLILDPDGLLAPGVVDVLKQFTVVVRYDADPGLAVERQIGADETLIVGRLLREDARLQGITHISFEESEVVREGEKHLLQLTLSTGYRMPL